MMLPSSSFSSSVIGARAAVGRTTVLAGSYFGEGLLLVPDKFVCTKAWIHWNVWAAPRNMIERQGGGREGSGGAALQKYSVLVTNILQWVQCFAAMVGLLSRAYPQMVSDLIQCTTPSYNHEMLPWFRRLILGSEYYWYQVAINNAEWPNCKAMIYSSDFLGTHWTNGYCSSNGCTWPDDELFPRNTCYEGWYRSYPSMYPKHRHTAQCDSGACHNMLSSWNPGQCSKVRQTGTQPGHRAKFQDCPGQTGTLGNYAKPYTVYAEILASI